MQSQTNLRKKGQVTLSDAPGIVLIVGLTFLIMATVAYIASSYGTSLATQSVTVTNESGWLNGTGYTLSGAGAPNFNSLSINSVTNGTSNLIVPTANYTVSSSGYALNTTAKAYPSVLFNYQYQMSGTAGNVTTALSTAINNNTSIAGIVLTISLVAVILGVPVGAFALFGNRKA